MEIFVHPPRCYLYFVYLCIYAGNPGLAVLFKQIEVFVVDVFPLKRKMLTERKIVTSINFCDYYWYLHHKQVRLAAYKLF